MIIYVFGGNHHNTIGVLRCLGQAYPNAELNAIVQSNSRNCMTSRCKFISNVYPIQKQSDGLDILISKRDPTKKQFLICCSDGAAEVVDNNLDLLAPYYYLQNANFQQGRIIHYMNKTHICELAKRCGFDMLQSISYNLNETLPDSITYPCITKPLASTIGGKNDIITCNNRQELVEAFDIIRNHGCYEVQIQQYIDKDYELSIVGCSLSGGKEVVIPGVIKKIREYPIKRGSSSFAALMPISEIEIDVDPVYRILRELGYTGLFSVEFLHKQDKNYFLEVNLRNDGNGYVSMGGDVNLPYILIESFIGNDISNIKKEVSCPVLFMNDQSDFKNILEHRISLFQWIKDFHKTSVFLLYNKLDKRPFIFKRRSILSSIIKGIIK